MIIDNIKECQAAWNRQRLKQKLPLPALAESLSRNPPIKTMKPHESLEELGIKGVRIGLQSARREGLKGL